MIVVRRAWLCVNNALHIDQLLDTFHLVSRISEMVVASQSDVSVLIMTESNKERFYQGVQTRIYIRI